MRRVVFAAVSGDADAIAFVEQHLGVGKVAMGPQTGRHLESAIPMHVFADRAITTRIAWRNAAHRELERLRTARLERTETRTRTAADIRAELSFSELLRLKAYLETEGLVIEPPRGSNPSDELNSRQ